MAKSGGYHFYSGGYDSLKPGYGNIFTGYRINAGDLGLTTDIRTADQLREVSTKLSSGQKAVEITGVMPKVFASIPNEQLKEINRLAQLTGAEMSMHAPIVEPSGIGQQGGFSEHHRLEAEREMMQVLDRSHDLDPKGNVTINFHSTGESAVRPAEVRIGTEGEEKGKEIVERMAVLDQMTGQIGQVSRQEFVRPAPIQEMDEIGTKFKVVGLEEGKHFQEVEEALYSRNATDWEDSLKNLIAPKEQFDKVVSETWPYVKEIGKAGVRHLTPSQQQITDRYQGATLIYKDIKREVEGLFERAYKYGNPEEQKILKELSEKYRDKMYEYDKKTGQIKKDLLADKETGTLDPIKASNLLQEMILDLSHFRPNRFKPVEKVAMEESAKTFGNVAYYGWEEYGKKGKAPIVEIENPPAGSFGLSRGEDLAALAQAAKDQFIKRAMAEKGMSKKKAAQLADKHIGVTWDVGHINNLRKFGFKKEHLVKEAKAVAKHLSKIHLADNFGMVDAELPMGMGNVPLQETLEALGEKAKKAKKIVETGDWWQHFKTSPIRASLQALGSPVYAMEMGPYWDQSNRMHEQGYFSGYGEILPSMNYQTWGAGFSRLPSELGGSARGGGSNFSGRPME